MSETPSIKAARKPVRGAWTALLLLLAAFAVYPALKYNIGAYAWDAATVHVYRGVAFSDAVANGGLWLPRWVQSLHLGLGSPVFTFSPPLAYAGMDLLARLGLPHPMGWRVLGALGLFAASAGAYLLAYELVHSRWAGLVAAVAFLYAPYVLRNLFERGSPEAFSTFLFPWVLWGLVRVARRPTGTRLLVASLLWALCICGHVLAPLMLAPFAALVAVILAWRQRTIAPLVALLAGVLLSAFVWAPMFAEQRWVHVERDFQAQMASPSEHPIPLDQLLAPPAVYDVARDNNSTQDRVGLPYVVLLAAGIPGIWAARRQRRDGVGLILAITALSALFLFFMLTSASDALWRALDPILGRLQYRSRLMGVQALAIAITAGALVTLLPGRWQPAAGLLLVAALPLAAFPSLYVDLQHRYAPFENGVTMQDVRQAEKASGGTALTSFGEFTPAWRTDPFAPAQLDPNAPFFDAQTQPLAEPAATVTVRTAEVQAGRWDLAFEASGPASLTLNLLYYPRWTAELDGQPVAIRPQEGTGYVQLDAPAAGSHRLILRYGSTTAERAGEAVSLLTLLGLLAAIPWLRRRTRPGGAPAGTAGSGPAQQPRDRTAPGGSPADASTRVAAASATGPDARHTDAAVPWWSVGLVAIILVAKIAYVDPATTWFRCVSSATHVCGASVTTNVPFANGPRLVGYTTPQVALQPGGEVKVTLYWRAEADQLPLLTSFVHIRNSQPGGPMNPATNNELWAQGEHAVPAGMLTPEMPPGRIYMDEFRVRLPDDMPAGNYFLEVGWANSTTGEQLDPQQDAVKPPLAILWRSILLPDVEVHAR